MIKMGTVSLKLKFEEPSRYEQVRHSLKVNINPDYSVAYEYGGPLLAI